ncbi:MAG: helix-turn-helix domain-containing protein [Chloroflexi bacterium]|nr:helix-turn-helix domain-containing protein [Chloroflexota bacterium]
MTLLARPDYYGTIAANLRAARKARGWTLLRVAVEIGTSEVAISHWEKGRRRPNAYDLDQMEQLLGRLRP